LAESQHNLSAIRRSRLRFGLLAFAGISAVFAVIATSLYGSYLSGIAENQRKQRAREVESIHNVKSGESRVTVYGTPEILEMLVADPDCIRNLHSIGFFICDLGDPRYEVITKLTNVDDIHVYDCHGIDDFLDNISGMESLKSVSFESVFTEGEMLKRLGAFPNLERLHFERQLDAPEVQALRQSLTHATIEYTDSQGKSIVEEPVKP
jgi:hypothetical protein